MSKIQFNSKEMKSFRNVCRDYYVARHAINDIILQNSKKKKAVQNLLDSELEDYSEILLGKYNGTRTLESVTASIKDLNTRLIDIEITIKSLTADYEKKVKYGLTLYTDNMYKAAKDVVSHYGDSVYIEEWRNAVADMFMDWSGMVITTDQVADYDFLLSVKSTSGKKAMKSGKLCSVSSRKVSAKVFMDCLVDYLAANNYITPYQYIYKEKKKDNKKDA